MNFIKNIIYHIFRKTDVDSLVKKGLSIGKNVSIQSDCIIDAAHCFLITIGDDVTIAPRVMIFAHDASTKRHINYTRIKKVSIGNKTFVGAGSIILPGVTIGKNVIIGAGSIVTKDIPDNSIVAGNPAKIIGDVNEYIKKHNKNLVKKPKYSSNWTLRGNMTKEMKKKMIDSLNDEGYVE